MYVQINGKSVEERLIDGKTFRKTSIKNLWVNPAGEVYNLTKARYMRASVINKYHAICRKKVYYVHRLVAEVFISVPKKYRDLGLNTSSLTVDHKDNNRTNNNVSNLRWLTLAENVSYGLSKKVMAKQGRKKIHFDSIQDAAQYMIDNRHTKKDASLKSVQSHISKVARGLESHNTAYKHKFAMK
jgi:hypothetical protein